MKSATEYLWFETRKQREYLNITEKVRAIVKKSGVREGMVLVSAMHITAGVYVNDAEDGLIQDIDEWLEKLAPSNPQYRHHRTGETNASEEPSHPPRGHRSHHRRRSGFRPLAADLLR